MLIIRPRVVGLHNGMTGSPIRHSFTKRTEPMVNTEQEATASNSNISRLRVRVIKIADSNFMNTMEREVNKIHEQYLQEDDCNSLNRIEDTQCMATSTENLNNIAK